jgi:mannose-6-phosphate isomerase
MIQIWQRRSASKIVVSVEHEVKSMAVEFARTCAVPKPWGTLDLRPWSNARHEGVAIGEIWYERLGRAAAADSSLLLKLLFTNQPLSIQVHPDDTFAHSIGLPSGKTEAWYVLSAAPEAKVALGLNQRLTSHQLREAIDDGSISNLVVWQTVSPDDVIFVPAGTIHAIGAGLVIAEVQQRSDTTFRLFDHGRQRDLHIESSVAVADAGPAHFQVEPNQLTDERTLLVSSSHFVFERIELAPNSTWYLQVERETWLLLVSGDARAGSFDIAAGDAIFVQSDRVDIHAGPTGMVGLVAYTSGDLVPHLLQRVGTQGAVDGGSPQAVPVPTFTPQAEKATPVNERSDLFQ